MSPLTYGVIESFNAAIQHGIGSYAYGSQYDNGTAAGYYYLTFYLPYGMGCTK